MAAKEAEVKAAFLFNFPKFIDWPRSSLAGIRQFTICLVDDSLEDALSTLMRNERIDGKPLRIIKKNSADTMDECQVVYVGRAEASVSVIRSAASGPVLTVGDDADFLRNGGIIRFMKMNNRIRFEINLEAAEKRGLQISSRLLRLAESVRMRD